jgi:hypothetical protein
MQDAPAEAVDGPGHHDIEFSPDGIFEHLIESCPFVPPLGAADTEILVGLGDEMDWIREDEDQERREDSA